MFTAIERVVELIFLPIQLVLLLTSFMFQLVGLAVAAIPLVVLGGMALFLLMLIL